MNGDICISSVRTNALEEGLKQTGLLRELVECLMRLDNQTRPDIANAVRAVARYKNSLRKVHWKTAVGIFAVTGTLRRNFTMEHLVEENGITYHDQYTLGSLFLPLDN